MSNIYDILLCSFDLTNGNVIEYSHNNHFTSDDSNISFKAMPDNCHTLDSLYNIININETHYGISYFKKVSIDDIKQRNSIYKALIIVTNQLNLSLLLKGKLKLTMDLILQDEEKKEDINVKELIFNLYSNLNMIYKDELYLDYIDNQLVDYNLERVLSICRDVDLLSIFKLLLLEKRIVFYTEEIALLEELVFLQVAIMSLYPNLLNKCNVVYNERERTDTNDDSFNVLDIMSKYKFLKLPLQILNNPLQWCPYLTIDEVDSFINPKNKNKSFMIGLGNSLFLNHKQELASKKNLAVYVSPISESQEEEPNNLNDNIDLIKETNKQKPRSSNKKDQKEDEKIHYDVAFKLASDGLTKLPKLEIDYWSDNLNKDSVESSSQDTRFVNVIKKEVSKFDSGNAKDKFIRKQFENYLVDMLYFIKLYYYQEFIKLTSLDYDELKEMKIKRGESQIEKNNRKLQLKTLEMILSESEHNKTDLNIRKQFNAFGGKPFFRKWFETLNYKTFMQSTDDRLFDIEMTEDVDFALERDYGSEEKYDLLLNGRFWSAQHPIYNLEKILLKMEEEIGSQWKLKLPDLKLPEVKLPDISSLNLTDMSMILPEVKIKNMMNWSGGLFLNQKSITKDDSNQETDSTNKESDFHFKQNEALSKQISSNDLESKINTVTDDDSATETTSVSVPKFKKTFYNTWNKLTKPDIK
ncbi:hypothetical protein QEN19_001908 [Hanseniaspora menglaensis]